MRISSKVFRYSKSFYRYCTVFANDDSLSLSRSRYDVLPSAVKLLRYCLLCFTITERRVVLFIRYWNCYFSIVLWRRHCFAVQAYHSGFFSVTFNIFFLYSLFRSGAFLLNSYKQYCLSHTCFQFCNKCYFYGR